MTNSQRLETVRAHLQRWLQSAQAGESDDPLGDESPRGGEICSESILIRDGYYVGRTFNLGAGSKQFHAIWFMEQDELKIRDPEGATVAVFCGDEIVGGGMQTQETELPTKDQEDEIVAEENDAPSSIPISTAAPTPDTATEEIAGADKDSEENGDREPSQGDDISKAA